MAAGVELPLPRIQDELDVGDRYLQMFKLYETRSNFYMIGRDKNGTFWRVLKINRLEPSELDVQEDPATYSDRECDELLKRIHEGNRPTGGLKFVTYCYGIVGFVQFLGPYYMLLITKRRQIGTICGHTIYTITKSRLITIPSSTVSGITDTISENRYKKLLSTVDLTKDFFFSYSYHIMRSLQKNLSDSQTWRVVYETMFVWNEFLTRGIRNHLKNTIWTVALVYGFFKQRKLSVAGKELRLTLIARRSRHYAGTRYLRRGVNEMGKVANDVETEQIVCEVIPEGHPIHVASVVQNRGSIPLYWSQETSRLNIKPDIILQKKDQHYEATRLHFENLTERYGKPIIILNLIKTQERKPRESKLRTEFANAIRFINKDSSEENQLRFLHWDLNRQPRRKAKDVLDLLGKVAAYALTLTGLFYCQVAPALKIDDTLRLALPGLNQDTKSSCDNQHISNESNTDVLSEGSMEFKVQSTKLFTRTFQKGVLRTNCIDCLDRTNVAQYAYGLTAFGYQLSALGLIDVPKIDIDDPLADILMSFYETMGDTLAVQYTGSAAHNKVFSERRGHWKAAIQSQEFLRTLQRYYSNAYMDAQKQDAIDLFLGYFKPLKGKPAIWDLDYAGKQEIVIENSRMSFRRCLSDGSILREGSTEVSGHEQKNLFNSVLSDKGESKGLSTSTPQISAIDSEISYSRYTPTVAGTHLFSDNNQIYFNGHVLHGSDFSNFLDLDQLSSSSNSCEEELYESNLHLCMSSSTNSPIGSLSTDSSLNDINGETTPVRSSESNAKVTNSIETEIPEDMSEFSKNFFRWVVSGETHWIVSRETLCH